MPQRNREIQELLIDYADALRDGCIPDFLKSLTREEAIRIASSAEFWQGTETTRILNSVAFGDKAVTPDVGLFISRVNAAIACRLKKARVPISRDGPVKRSARSRPTLRQNSGQAQIRAEDLL